MIARGRTIILTLWWRAMITLMKKKKRDLVVIITHTQKKYRCVRNGRRRKKQFRTFDANISTSRRLNVKQPISECFLLNITCWWCCCTNCLPSHNQCMVNVFVCVRVRLPAQAFHLKIGKENFTSCYVGQSKSE